MKTSVHAGGTAREKAQGIVSEFVDLWPEAVVIDVGCRTRELEAALAGQPYDRYVGVDIDPNAEVIADLGDRLPFEDGSADIVTAFDVLEHTDDIHKAFSELCRVARRNVLITLPNCYEAGIRLRVLRGKQISAKYGLPESGGGDRHRWFFSLNDAATFLKDQGHLHGWEVTEERAIIGPSRARISGVVGRWPNLLAGTYLAVLTKH